MTIVRLLFLFAIAGVVALVVAGPGEARLHPDYCRWASKNAHICWYYHGGAFHACDDQADGHRVRVWIKSHGTSTTDPNSNKWYVKVPNKTSSRRACTGLIHEPGGLKGEGFWQFRMCIDHEGCTKWRYCRNGKVVS